MISTQVEDLLDDGAIHANAQDYDGRRPLHLAAGEEHLEVVTLLLSRGADPGVRDRWGHAPLDGCSHDGPCEKALMEAGAPPRRMDGSQASGRGDQTPRDGGCDFMCGNQILRRVLMHLTHWLISTQASSSPTRRTSSSSNDWGAAPLELFIELHGAGRPSRPSVCGRRRATVWQSTSPSSNSRVDVHAGR